MSKTPRFFYNNDGSFLKNYRIVPPLSMEEFLYESVGRVIGTQVDALVCNMFDFGDASPTYPSAVPEARRVYLEDFESVGEWREQENVRWAIEQDAWQDAVEAAHDAGIRFWAGMRFNDIHPRRWTTEFRANHPQYELGDRCGSGQHEPGAYFVGERCRGYDFSIPEVRAHRLKLVEEVCTRYDVDGFEWDFMREYKHLLPDVEDRESILTDYMREARELLRRIGEKRGRAVGFGVRVSPTLEKCHAEGMEMETWVREDLVDYVSPSPFAPTVTQPFFKPFVDLTRGTGCRVYACCSEQMDGRWSCPGKWGPPPASALRAGMFNAWQEGVDGVYLFNFNVQIGRNRTEDRILLHELGNPASLEFKDKLYLVTANYNRVHLTAYDFPLPLEFETQPTGPGETIEFSVGDDLKKAAGLGILDGVRLVLTVGEPAGETVECKLNGRRLKDTRRLGYERLASSVEGNVKLIYTLKGEEWIRRDRNELEVAVRKRNPKIRSKFTIYELSLEIRYRALPMRATAE